MMDISKLYGSPSPALAEAVGKRNASTAMESRKEDIFRQLMEEAGLAGPEDAAGEEVGESGVIDQIADPDSAFYQDMFQRIRIQWEMSEEEKKKQAIIDALGAILDGMRSTDGAVKRKDPASSMAELSKEIGQMDDKDPRKKELELFRQRLNQLGILADLDLGVKGSKDKDWQTLTEYLIGEEKKEAIPDLFDLI